MLDVLYKLHHILTRKQRKKYIWLQLLFVVTAVIQVAGVASIAPFIALLSNPKLIHENTVTNLVFEQLHFKSDASFLIFFALGVMIFTVFSNAIGALTLWASVTFSQNLGVELQSDAYRSFLYKDHLYFSKNNSSSMVTTLAQESQRFVFMVLQPILNLFSQLFVVLVIAAGLLIVDPTVAIVALIIIGASYVGIFRKIKKRLAHYGDMFNDANNRKFKLLSESLGGIKEVKLLGTEASYEEKLRHLNTINAKATAIPGFLADLPKYVVESLAFCALLGLGLYLFERYGNSGQVNSILSLYAIAGYKLLPAAQNVFKYAAHIKANRSALDVLYPEVIEGRTVETELSDPASPPVTDITDIRFQDVSFSYPEAAAPALNQVNLTIRKNSLVAFVGPSGAGKSTMADLLLGFLLPDNGSMRVGTIEIRKSNKRSWQKHLGYVPQNIFLLDDTITANIAFGVPGKDVDNSKVRAAARLANIDEFIETLPGQYSFVVGERGAMLSGGQKQRIGIARALYHDADVLVLDEATSALDNISEREVMNTLLNLKTQKTIIMIAHRLSTIRNADQIAFFDKGRLEDAGTFDSLSQRNRKFSAMINSATGSQVHAG